MNLFTKIVELLKSKRFILIVILAAIVAGYFWSQSRYPALDLKAIMGADTQIEGIGFDILVNMPPRPTTWERIYTNTINWVYTNRKGMTFGVIFGAVIMCLMPFLINFQFRNRFANSAVGILIGAPLGLCVNCSTPVAHGLHEKGGRLETMLAAMMSSPTLNVIAITMLFTMFPTWIGVQKVAMTLGFILIGIPLLTKYFGPNETVIENQLTAPELKTPFDNLVCDTAKEEDCVEAKPNESWLQAAIWVGKEFFRNLWKLVKITVPLMILAGVLGSILVTLYPLDRVVTGMPDSRLLSWGSMFLVALIALFLPAPMTFDVILCAILYNAGMPVKYVAIILFTLGIFSVYPFMTIWRRISWKLAFATFGVLILLGMINGVIANRYFMWDNARQQQLIFKPFAKSGSSPVLNTINREQQGVPADELLSQLKADTLKSEKFADVEGLSINRLAFNSSRPTNPENSMMFKRYHQKDFGITEHENYSSYKMNMRHSVSRGIASGDVNRDGWTDFVITSDAGFALYLNKKGESFVQQRIEISDFNNQVINSAALVDLNNDGWLDLWFTTFRQGNFLITNSDGKFLAENMKKFPNQPDADLTGSTAFGDLNRDGKLDIVLGNVSLIGKTEGGNPYKSSRNVWLRSTEKDYVMENLAGPDGESLTALISDINGDGIHDLIIGNDLQPPDVFYLGDGKGGLKLITKQDGLIPNTVNFTMSIANPDVDNDLVPELLFGSISKRDNPAEKGASRRLTGKEICAEMTDEGERNRCEKFIHYREILIDSMSTGQLWQCNSLTDLDERNSCIAHVILQKDINERKEGKLCKLMPEAWEFLNEVCLKHYAETFRVTPEERETFIPQKKTVNAFLKRNASGNYDDVAKDFGLLNSGWTWNAKFADLDNDSWQDLYVVNGWLRRVRTESNYFYRNLEGKKFEDITELSGLESNLSTLSYTYLDIDNDGDLDIISVPSIGTIGVYINQTPPKQSIAFELNDKKGNFYGIGSKIIINYGDGKKQMREIQASGGYLSFDAPLAYFGLGDEQIVKSVEIQWSTGEKSVIEKEFKAGGRYIISRSK